MYKQIPEAIAQNKIELKNGHHHTNVLVRIAELFEYNSYLEIGINLPQECFDLIPCKKKQVSIQTLKAKPIIYAHPGNFGK